MDPREIPIACTLAQGELAARREWLTRVSQSVEEVQELGNGYAYKFASDTVLTELIEIVKAERACCPFLRFVLTMEPGQGAIWLEMTGPDGTKTFLQSLFT